MKGVILYMNITEMINETKQLGGEVWVFSDWHLLKKEKDRPRIIRRDNVFNVVNEYLKNINPEKDMIIFLGDFVDDTIPRPLMLRTMINVFEPVESCTRKVWIRGNNDMMAEKLLINRGWSVCYSAVAKYLDKWMVFSHTSLEMGGSDVVYNVHGHMHRNDNSQMYYYHDPMRCVNIAPGCNVGHGLTLGEIIMRINDEPWNQATWYQDEEKPGMSRFIYEMATAEFTEDYYNFIYTGWDGDDE